MKGSGNYATDWGSLAIVRPEVISVPMAVVFTGCAYLYMCLCFYLFFVGLILLHTVAHDLWKIGEALKIRPDVECLRQLNDTKRIRYAWDFSVYCFRASDCDIYESPERLFDLTRRKCCDLVAR